MWFASVGVCHVDLEGSDTVVLHNRLFINPSKLVAPIRHELDVNESLLGYGFVGQCVAADFLDIVTWCYGGDV